MRRILLINMILGLLLHSSIFAQSPARKCYSDQVDHVLRQQYPDGVPGRVAASNKTDDASELPYVIPVVVHVMHDNGPLLGVTLEQVQSQIDVLNEDYNRYGAGANQHPDGATSHIRFCLASIDPDGNATAGIEFIEYPEAANIDPVSDPGSDTLMKRISQWDPNRYLNIWVVRRIANGRIEGYAYFPDEVAGTVWDGLVIDYRKLGRQVGTGTTYGRTATHEVGHYLGLQHPWGRAESGSCEQAFDDECDDTPKVFIEYFSQYPNCLSHPACDPGFRQIENYMDYSDDRCMDMFTNCQVSKMRQAIVQYRGELVSTKNLAATGCLGAMDSSQVGASGEVLLYPNPAQDQVFVYYDLEDEQDISVVIYDYRGAEMYRNELEGKGRGPLRVDLATFNTGIYFMVTETATQRYQHRIVVSR